MTILYREKRCLKMQDAHMAETEQSLRPFRPKHQQRRQQDQQFEGGENFDYYVGRKTGWRYIQRATGKPAGRVFMFNFAMANELELLAAHIIHHLRHGGDFGFLEGIPEIDGVWTGRTPTHNTHLCSTVCSQARNAHTTRLAQELHCHRCAPEKNLVIWCVPCPILGCLACLSPRALHLPHSLFLLRHKNTQHNRYNSENTQYITHISKLPQSTSCAIKNHSGVKTCTVAETRAPQLPQVMSPKNLRLSQGSKLIWRRRSPSSCHRRSVGIWIDWDSWLTGF